MTFDPNNPESFGSQFDPALDRERLRRLYAEQLRNPYRANFKNSYTPPPGEAPPPSSSRTKKILSMIRHGAAQMGRMVSVGFFFGLGSILCHAGIARVGRQAPPPPAQYRSIMDETPTRWQRVKDSAGRIAERSAESLLTYKLGTLYRKDPVVLNQNLFSLPTKNQDVPSSFGGSKVTEIIDLIDAATPKNEQNSQAQPGGR